LADRKARAHDVGRALNCHRWARYHHHHGDFSLDRQRRDTQRGRRDAAEKQRHLVIDNEFLRQAFADIRHAGIIFEDDLDLPADHRGTVLLHIEPCSGHGLLAVLIECTGHRLNGANPRYAIALRHLAAGLAMQGNTDAAAAVVREILDIEPNLTLSNLRTRLMFMNDWGWSRFAEGLRRAGLPE
jgi:hypothetical protein